MRPENPAIAEFVERARAVSIAAAADRLGLVFKARGSEHPQPCPVQGGRDCFAFNTVKHMWHCRACSLGGQDAIGMAAHCLDLDVRSRTGLLEACVAVTGEDVPAGGERESDEARAARQERIAQARRKADAEAAKRASDQADFRERERTKARGIWEAAEPLRSVREDRAREYLRRRGCGVPDDRWLRVSAEQSYWHGADERGQPVALHAGPAMIAPFVRFGDGLAVEMIGCHITWIDLSNRPKFRPLLADPETGEVLPTKKMRGTKKGGVIPLAGSPSACRWLGAEGIENTLAFARCEEFRDDTFYFAAGDLGNLAGPADPKSRFAHPTLKKPDKNGRERSVMIAGPVPSRRGDGEPDAMEVPDHVDELVLLADGDSERVMTAAAMVRARARHARPGRLIPVVWPKAGSDFAAMLADRDDAYNENTATGGEADEDEAAA